MRVLLLSIFISMLLLQVCYTVKYEDNARLIYNLLGDYDIFSFQNVNVSIGLSLTDVTEVDGELLTFNVWQRMSWEDFRLRWSVEDYKVTSLHLPINKIWSPDIFLYNQARKDVNLANVPAIVKHNGNILYIPPKLITVRCPLDKKRGEYHCNFKYASWTYHGNEIDVNFYNDMKNIDFADYYGKYRIIKNTGRRNVKHYACCEESYPDITFTIIMSKS
ncbi:DgyrCDS14710 [Dimorphilus gyrociliatus]|uniref:DgyrCDS14710 n=1 Tax=Dimorphilus gyrociliatus TaxID=2664684 RepID=A0A7I8WET6_9ANNE|nr:DgyrCDS14710 [Dimorphilus gyrociliatus]